MTAPRGRTARGAFWSFEGIEGSGKSTQIRLLAEWLRSRGREVEVVREPGGTVLGESLRALLLATGAEPIDPRAELCLYLAARAQLITRVIRPGLEAGRIVLADRFGDASVAYQGGGRGLGMPRVRALVRFATGGLTPGRTFLLDLPPEVSLGRVRSRGIPDRFEAEGIAFHRRVRRSYRALALAEPRRFRVLRADAPVERIAQAIREDAAALLASISRRLG